MTFQNSKADIRKTRLSLRDAFTPEERIEKSLDIADHGAAIPDFAPGTIISGYHPIRSEPDVRPLLAALRLRGGRLCLPVVLDRETIVFRELVAGAELVDTGFGTRGPGPDAAVLVPGIMLMPLSAFDSAGNRIGYGAGHYDRAIDRARKGGITPWLIGIAFDCQEVPQVPFEPHDVGLDAIITESGFRKFGTQAWS